MGLNTCISNIFYRYIIPTGYPIFQKTQNQSKSNPKQVQIYFCIKGLEDVELKVSIKPFRIFIGSLNSPIQNALRV